jgi:hypothetical protein
MQILRREVDKLFAELENDSSPYSQNTSLGPYLEPVKSGP